jgi:hypothetical protein
MLRHIKIFLENYSNGKPLYYFINSLLYLFLIREISFSKAKSINFFLRKLVHIKLKIGYKLCFLNLDLKKAYKFKILHLILIYKRILKGNPEKAYHQLQIFKNDDLLSFLQLNDEVDDFMRFHVEETMFLHEICSEKKSNCLGNVIILGPKENLLNLDISEYDTVVILKTPKFPVQFGSKKNIVMLNNIWIKKEFDRIKNWLTKYDSIIISPQDIDDLNIKKEKLYELIPTGLFGASPMGLQRALMILSMKYNFKKIFVTGFDFGLSEQQYHHSYPSVENSKNKVLISNVIHDFLYNFLLTRLIFTDHRIDGEIRDILNLSVQDLVTLFIKTYK